MARSTATIRGLPGRNRQPGLSLTSRPRGTAAVPQSSLRQRPKHGFTRPILNQRPEGKLPKARAPEAYIPPRPSSPPQRQQRVQGTGGVIAKGRKRT